MKKRCLLVIAAALSFFAMPANAGFGPNVGNENIGFSVRDGNGQRPSWATGSGEGSLTCEKRLGRDKTRTTIGGNTFSLPGTYTAQVIRFDQTTVDNQLRSPSGVVARFRWGDATSSDGIRGTLKTIKREHALDLGRANVLGVAMSGVQIFTRDGFQSIRQEGENDANFLASIDNNSFASPKFGGVRAKCPNISRQERSACELSGVC